MGEYVVAGIINFERGLYRYFELQKAKSWDDLISLNFRTLSDLRVAILGAGVIGEEIAKCLVQFGATVNGFARRNRNSEELRRSSFQNISPDLHTLIEDCHYLVNALPSTPNTVGLLNGDVLRQCKNSPVFINIGRGNVIAEECLLNALKNKWISGAMLDVFEVEPLPQSSPLWSTPDVIVTPHMSGPSRPQEADAERLRGACDKLMGLVDRNGEMWKEFFDRAEEAGARMERICDTLVSIAEDNENMVVQFGQSVQAGCSRHELPEEPETPSTDSSTAL
ncbi:hypothetical protein HPB52_010935 [Rhipicephalus sanguineus]|uniref:D-isomer specific 2-hydroxyacid dehydrogenase NAD-binding domain-containing protein n=1 Tax=Rhipicephalus sanguineus TaxID=34632 RepID=A0A9D4PRB3_RHISA|nr:hypothetical protein HPB52_010935 [Rhipicephalus sanguineus]